MKSVKIKTVLAPDGDLSVFDPGSYISQLEFYETDEEILESDKEGLADFLHFLAYLALSNKSINWEHSVVPSGCTAYKAISSHFSSLNGWDEIDSDSGINYKSLVSFLMPYYKPGSSRNA